MLKVLKMIRFLQDAHETRTDLIISLTSTNYSKKLKEKVLQNIEAK